MSVLDKDSHLQFPHVLIIDASAGSGKTETLAQRFVQFLLSRAIRNNDLSHLLAITFTNNAAREMKQRILTWLKVAALELPRREREQLCGLVDLDPRALAAAADTGVEMIIDRYSDFHIQTIDSFMMRILRASAVELGLPMECDVTESYTQLVALALSILERELLREIPIEKIECFLDLLELESGSQYVWDPVGKMERRFTEFLIAEGKELQEISFLERGDDFESHIQEIFRYYDAVKRAGYRDLMRKPIRDTLEARPFSLSKFLTQFSPETLWFKSRGLTGEALATCTGLLDSVKGIAETYALTHYAHYAPFYGSFKRILQGVKRSNEILHFDDINKRLVEYINTENIPEIYYRLGDSLYHFLLDEFQDTDIVQWENMQLLLNEAFAKGGSLFAVGDLKQAIYMFRKADYKIMRRMVEGIRTGREYEDYYLPRSVMHNARVERLTENYRSGSVILSYVDMVFKDRLQCLTGTALLKEDVTGLTTYVQEARPPSVDAADARDHDQGYVKTSIVFADETIPEKRVLADILVNVLGRYNARDIAILARKNEEVEKIVEWLTEKEIHAASFSSLDIRKRRVVMEIVALVQFLDSPPDSLSFVTFITGAIFARALGSAGVTWTQDDIQHALFTQSTQFSGHFYTWFREHATFKGLWNIFFEDLFNKVGYMPLYDLVSQIYRTFQLFRNFPEETGFLVKFLEAISDLESRGLNNIKDFLKMVTGENGESMMEIVLPDFIDAVKVMTFHKAKGLGYPVVINMLYESRKRSDPMFMYSDETAVRPVYITKGFTFVSPLLARIHDQASQDSVIQDLNMLYVANTRAKKELYNIIIRTPSPARAAQGPDDHSYIELFEEFENGSQQAHEKAVRHIEPLEVKMTGAPEGTGILREEGSWSIGRLVEARTGEVYHAVLERIEYLDAKTDVARCVRQACRQVRGLHDDAAILKNLQQFLDAPEVRQWFLPKVDRRVLIEQEFVGKNGSVFRPDRVIIDEDAVTVIDFKTGDRTESHIQQVQGYMAIIKEIHPDQHVHGYLSYIDRVIVEEIG
ncbi:UvrD-helicase domain-containing protein [candidate division WOR-3 bacterium]|nr:UvrD-helicase domain-containing protein [candidate division WOR-3 bacterium]